MFLLHSEPSLNDYVSAQEHDRSIPAKYSDDLPVLHYHVNAVPIRINGELAGNIAGDQEAAIIIASNDLTLWISELQKGVSIQYTEIILHASQMEPEPGVYLQIASAAEDENTVEIFIKSSEHQKIYEALSACSSLHIDAESESESESMIQGQIEIAEYMGNTDGQADDDISIEDENGSARENESTKTTAGIEVEIPQQVHAGIRRAHPDDEEQSKWRRTE